MSLFYGGTPPCPSCQQPMRKATKYTDQVSGLIVALLLIAIGLAVIIFIPCFGWVIGPLLILLALTKGAKPEGVAVQDVQDLSTEGVRDGSEVLTRRHLLDSRGHRSSDAG